MRISVLKYFTLVFMARLHSIPPQFLDRIIIIIVSSSKKTSRSDKFFVIWLYIYKEWFMSSWKSVHFSNCQNDCGILLRF